MTPDTYLNVKLSCRSTYLEVLVAELSIMNYNSMMELEYGLEASIKKEDFEEKQILELVERYPDANITFTIEEVVEVNWNEEWEKNYDPIEVENTILVRATFHPPQPAFKYDLLITPRMSFGTGHHATTYLMLKHQLTIDHQHKRVLDAGCGTAILAVMAEKLGATDILAYDNNAWSAENTPENIRLNHCRHIAVQEGTIDTIAIEGEYDIILANINKNVLLRELSQYMLRLKDGGKIVLSGFYTDDNTEMIQHAKRHQLKLLKKSERNNWSSLIFHKN